MCLPLLLDCCSQNFLVDALGNHLCRQWTRKFLISSVLWAYISCLRCLRNGSAASLSGDAPFQIQVWHCVPTAQNQYLLVFRNTTKYKKRINRPILKYLQSICFNLTEIIYMQSNKIHSVVLMSKFYSALFVSSTCFGPHRSIIRSVLYKLYSQTLVCGNTRTTRHVPSSRY